MATFVLSLKEFEWIKGSKYLFCSNPNIVLYDDGSHCREISIRSHITGKEYKFHFSDMTVNESLYYQREVLECPISAVYIGTREQMDQIKRSFKLIYPNQI